MPENKDNSPIQKKEWFIIFLCIFAPYIAAIILWIKKKWSAKARIGVTIWAIIFIVIINKTNEVTKIENQSNNTTMGQNQNSNKVEPNRIPDETALSNKTTSKTDKNTIAEAKVKAERVAAEKKENPLPFIKRALRNEDWGLYLRDVKLVENSLIVSYKPGISRVFTKKSNSKITPRESFDFITGGILNTIHEQKIDLSSVKIEFYDEFVDRFGNQSTDIAMSISYDSLTMNQVNWRNYASIEFISLGNLEFLHPAWKEYLQP